ncbi:MAG TPA: YbhB/YbcL family Raf kinase inhibitor-like protein, partial [Gemmatimonadaceae bacterium]|nr:YbhB/YbcL family Raf kinase inhibitor-like protein [Gemmatimonadaceae bacterium]
GADRSPPLAWSGAPAQTRSSVLLVEDPDAPGGTFVHWVLYDIPATITALPEGVPEGASPPQLGGAHQGHTSFRGAPRYSGPCPPRGAAHHYHFRLFALDAPLRLAAGATRAQVAEAMREHELASAELVGTYARQ